MQESSDFLKTVVDTLRGHPYNPDIAEAGPRKRRQRPKQTTEKQKKFRFSGFSKFESFES